MEHVKKTKAENPDLSFKEVLVKAGKSYKSKAEKGAAPAKKRSGKKRSGKKKTAKKLKTKSSQKRT